MARNSRGNQNSKSTVDYSIAEDGCIKLLNRHVSKGGDEWDFYDVCISNTVIIKDCRIVEGKNGDFVATPSSERNGKYYPHCYISGAVQDAILDLVENEEAWDATDITYLEFEGKGSKGSASKRFGRSARHN